MVTFIIGFLVGFIPTLIIDLILKCNKSLRKKYWDNPRLIFGYHFHHSLIGLLLLVIGFFTSILLLGVGLGIIVSHTISDRRLIFIEKINEVKK